MKKEINAALDLLMSYVQRFGSIKDDTVEQLRKHLQETLLERYQGHWYPDKPIKGQAYRSLEFNKENDYCDVIVSQICQDLNIASNLLGIRHELTLWIDPYEITIRLGNHASPKENQSLIVARFDRDGNELIRTDLDTLLSQSRIPAVAATPASRASPTNSSSCDSASCSGSSTPQRTSSPFPTGQPAIVHPIGTPPTSMFRNELLFTPPRALSPQAPAFQMSPSAPIKVPVRYEQMHQLHNHTESVSCEGSPSDGNQFHQPDRSDTPHSMHSTTSNESSDSGYCGYVESFPYYYKLNRLYKALAIQKLSSNGNPVGRGATSSPMSHQGHQARRPPQYQYPHAHQQHSNHVIPSSLSTSPPTPTPMNINQVSPFYSQQSSYLPMPTTVTDSRKSKY